MGSDAESTYLRYLPPVLWRSDQEDFSVGALLRVTEKLLSGIDDDASVVHRPAVGATHAHDGIEAVIDRLHLLLDPVRTPARFLPWLASWVGLQLSPLWDERQQRTAIAQMVPIYAERGLKVGLDRYLALHTVAASRPRITVDDGARMLFTDPRPGMVVPIHALLSHGPFLRADGKAAYGGVAHPRCIAATPDGHLLLGDGGLRRNTAGVPPGIWRVTRAGAYVDTAGSPPRPRALGQLGLRNAAGSLVQWLLNRPLGLVVDHRTTPWQVYVLDFRALYRLTAPRLDEATSLGETGPAGSLKISDQTEAMILGDPGRLLVLDTKPPGIVEIDLTTKTPTGTPRAGLPTDVVPMSLTRFGNGFVVGAGRDEESTRPAELFLVDQTNRTKWRVRPLLATLSATDNPLVAPTALVADGPDSLLVLDVGLRPIADPAGFVRRIAEPAAIYRVEVDRPARSTPRVRRITRVTDASRLCSPRGMTAVDGTLYVADPGEPESASDPPLLRASDADFAVFVHFSQQRPTTAAQQNIVIRNVGSIVNNQKPADAAPLVNWNPLEPD